MVEKGHMWIEKDTLGWMRNAHGVEKDKRGLKRASSYLERRAFKLLEKAYVELKSLEGIWGC